MASNLLLLVEPLNAGRRLDRQTVATAIRLGYFSSRRSRFLSSGIRISFPKSAFHMSSS
jgi:hypothetical protein